jgi:hypothetical protein
VKAEAFTVMAFMVTADIVVFGVVVGVCDGRGSGVAGALPIGKKPIASREPISRVTRTRGRNGFWCAALESRPELVFEFRCGSFDVFWSIVGLLTVNFVHICQKKAQKKHTESEAC